MTSPALELEDDEKDEPIDITDEVIHMTGRRRCAECHIWHESALLHICPAAPEGNYVPEGWLSNYELEGIEEAGEVVRFRRRYEGF